MNGAHSVRSTRTFDRGAPASSSTTGSHSDAAESFASEYYAEIGYDASCFPIVVMVKREDEAEPTEMTVDIDLDPRFEARLTREQADRTYGLKLAAGHRAAVKGGT